MKQNSLYTTGQFMKLTHVTKKTIRYYDEHDILKPCYVAENGNRYYSDADLAKMQQILLLKQLGFSLSDIREITINDTDTHLLSSSLKLQKKLVDDKIEQMQVISKTIEDTITAIDAHKKVDWSEMLTLIHDMSMEQTLKTQYQNASNISSRINLRTLYSKNTQGWFPWIFEQCQLMNKHHVLEIGCGDGAFWTNNVDAIPNDISIILSDISSGMLRDAHRNIGDDNRFSFQECNCEDLPFKNNQFELVLADHVLFYSEHIDACINEVYRVLKPGGYFICSTYSSNHMKEIRELTAQFDDRIRLSDNNLYERFGRENGTTILSQRFTDISWKCYEDSLYVTNIDALLSYILSCHGNQNQYILDRFKEFRTYLQKKMGKGLYITKDAGIFICRK